MVRFLNTSWTGARFCLKRSIWKTRLRVLAGTCGKSRKSAKTICFLVSNVLLGYPTFGLAAFPCKRERVDREIVAIVTPKGGRIRSRPTPGTLRNEPPWRSQAPNLTNLRGSKDSLKLILRLRFRFRFRQILRLRI